MKIMGFGKATRITVVSEDSGIAFEQYDLYKNGVEIHLQDDGRTLKIFPMSSSTPCPECRRVDGQHKLDCGQRSISTAEEAVREMHARELHHFEEEQLRTKAEAERDALRAAIQDALRDLWAVPMSSTEEARSILSRALNDPVPAPPWDRPDGCYGHCDPEGWYAPCRGRTPREQAEDGVAAKAKTTDASRRTTAEDFRTPGEFQEWLIRALRAQATRVEVAIWTDSLADGVMLDAADFIESLSQGEPTDDMGKRLDPEFRADLVDAAKHRILDAWADSPEGVDAETLAQNVVAAQEFLWIARAFPVAKVQGEPSDYQIRNARNAWIAARVNGASHHEAMRLALLAANEGE